MASIGPYQLEAQIGAGGFAEVYRSTHPVLGVPVAIKVLHPFYAAHPITRARMLQEARLTLRLRHPGIVHMYDVGEHQGRLHLVMELLQAGSLRAALQRARPTTAEALTLGRTLADALAYAHAQGVLHRDLKPENILLRDGQPVIADFGLAGPLAADERITQPGAIMGTPAYMAPEQIEGRPTDSRTDVYALGAVLFEFLTGTPPFGYQPQSASYRHVHAPAPRLASLDSRVPPALDVLLAAMLAKDPADRPPDMRAVSRALGRILEQASSGTAPLPEYVSASAPQPAPHPAPQPRATAPRARVARNVALAFGLAVVVLIGLSAAYAYWRDHRSATPVAVQMLDRLVLVGARTSELGQDRFTVANIGIRRSGSSAYISGLLRNDSAAAQSSIEVRAIGHDANGGEAWSAANEAYTDSLMPGEIAPFEILVDDGATVPSNSGALDFEVRGETSRYEPQRVALRADNVALGRIGDRYTISGVLHGGEQPTQYPALLAILFDDAGTVLNAELVSLPDASPLAVAGSRRFSLDAGRLAEPPARLYVQGRGTLVE